MQSIKDLVAMCRLFLQSVSAYAYSCPLLQSSDDRIRLYAGDLFKFDR